MKTQEAQKLLSDSLKKIEIEHTLIKNDKDVRFTTRRDSVTVDCWWNSQTEEFGFDLIAGGIKSYKTCSDFEHAFRIYLGIYTIFIPKAKHIADAYEKIAEIQTIYKSFKGSEANGYIAFFSVIGEPLKEVVVHTTKEKGVYTLKYIEKVSEEDTKGEVLESLDYKVNEVGEAIFLPNVNTYLAELAKRYNQSDEVDIDRIGKQEFDYIFEDITVSSLVMFEDGKVEYLITNINGALQENIKVEFNDPYDMTELHTFAKNYLKEHGKSEAEEEEKPTSDDNDFDFDEPSFEEEMNKIKEKELNEMIKKGKVQVIKVEEHKEEKEEPTKEETSTEEETQLEDSTEEVAETSSAEVKEETTEVVEEESTSEEESEESVDETDASEEEETEEVDETTDEESSDEPEDVEEVTEDVEEEQEEVETSTEETSDEKTDKSEGDNDMPRKSVEADLSQDTEETSIDTENSENEVVEPNNDITSPMSVKVVIKGNAPLFVRFDLGEKMFDVPVTKVPFPLDIVEDTVEIKKNKGISITDEERTRRVFAKKVEDEEKINELVDMLFS